MLLWVRRIYQLGILQSQLNQAVHCSPQRGFQPQKIGSWIMNTFCYSISIYFAIIIQLSLPLKWLNFQEHHRFHALMVFTRPNELNVVSESSQSEDINFPLWDVVVVTCWDPPPDTRQEVALSKPHGKPHFQEKSLRFCFFPNTKVQFTAVLLVERNRMCALNAGWRERIVKMKH